MSEYTDQQSPDKATPSNKKQKTNVVNDKISKSTTIGGSPVNQIVFNPVLEAVDKTRAVVAFGRHQPFTNGHKNVLDTVESEAANRGAQAHFITSHSEGTGKNPIPSATKVKLIKKVAKPSTQVYSSDEENPTLLHQLSKLHKSGVRHITYVGGSDRVGEMTKLIKKYNGVEGKHGYFNFDSIDSASSGERDPDAEGTAGVSGTKVRAMARAGNEKEFKQQIPKQLHPHAKEVMKSISQFNEQMEMIENIEEILDQVLLEQERYDRTNTFMRDIGTSTLTDIYKYDTPGQGVPMDYKLRFKDPKNDKEAMTRSGQRRHKIDMVPRKDPSRDRHLDSDFYRQQAVTKNTFEAKMSPWDKMVKAMPRLKDSEQRAQQAKAGLEKAGNDYQAILDKEAEQKKKKTNEAFFEAVNSSGGGGVRGLGYVSGSGDNDSSDPYLDANIANADTRDNIMAGHVQTHSDMHTAGNATVVKASATPTVDPERELDKGSQLSGTNKLAVNGISDKIGASKTVAKEETLLEIGDTEAGQKALKKTWYRANQRAISATQRSGEGLIGHLGGQDRKVMQQNHKVMRQVQKRVKDSKFFEDTNEESIEEKINNTSVIQSNHRKQMIRHKKMSALHFRPKSKNSYLGNYRNLGYGEHLPKPHHVHEDVTTEKDPLAHLEDRLNKATDTSHNAIDKIMRDVARDYDMDVHDLHDKWIKKYKITPDQYCKEEYQTFVTDGNVEHLEENSTPTNPSLWSRAKALARSKFDVYPSAYANGWAAKWYKSKGGGWKSSS